jgi:hypothetical protein
MILVINKWQVADFDRKIISFHIQQANEYLLQETLQILACLVPDAPDVLRAYEQEDILCRLGENPKLE